LNIPFSRYWDLLSRYIQPQKGRFISLVALLFTSIALQVVNPQIMSFFIDTTQTTKESRLLIIAATAFISIALIQQAVGVGATYTGEYVAWIATNELRAEMAEHCLHLDMRQHNDMSPGELIERIDGDVTELSNFFSQLVIRVLGNIILMIGILIAMFFVDWRVGVAFTVFSILTMLALNAVRGLAIPVQKKFRESQAEFFGYLEERLAGTEDIRSSGAVDFVILGVYKLSYKMLGFWWSTNRRFVFVRLVAGTMLTIGISMALFSGYTLVRQGLITLGTAYLIVFYTNLLRRPIRELTHQVENLQNIGAATERLRDLRAIQSQITDGPGAEIPPGALALDFEGRAFRLRRR
jgi:ATP-binding cassette, subfamily B, bacterial